MPDHGLEGPRRHGLRRSHTARPLRPSLLVSAVSPTGAPLLIDRHRLLQLPAQHDIVAGMDGGPRNGFGFPDGHGGNHGRRRGDDIGIWVNGGEWARWNNQTWRSDSFNDWWHDRPDRAYPAWVRNNQMMQNCRLYYSGGGWRC